jgi:hypothetical protein
MGTHDGPGDTDYEYRARIKAGVVSGLRTIFQTVCA